MSLKQQISVHRNWHNHACELQLAQSRFQLHKLKLYNTQHS